jgi:Uma2 family endonuclease
VRRLGYGPVRFTVSDALEMVEQGILPEDGRIELLEGSLVYRDRFDLRGDEIVEGPKHTYVIAAIAQISPRIDNERRHLRTQSTLICSETHAPIPDAVVLRGSLSDYRDRLPTAADAFCVIEVADSSYERDTGEKLTGYAKAGIRQYVIINLRARTAEVFIDPDASKGIYPPAQVVNENENLSLHVSEQELFTLVLSALMP